MACAKLLVGILQDEQEHIRRYPHTMYRTRETEVRVTCGVYLDYLISK